MKILIFSLFVGGLSVNLSGQLRLILEVDQFPRLEVSQLEDMTATPGEKVILGEKVSVTGGYGSYSYHWRPDQYVDNVYARQPWANIYQTTVFTLVVKDDFGCSDTTWQVVRVENATSSGPGISPARILLYPVPARDFVYLRIPENMPAGKIEFIIFNMKGSEVLHSMPGTAKGGTYKLNIRDLSPGAYTLLARSLNSLYRLKLIVY